MRKDGKYDHEDDADIVDKNDDLQLLEAASKAATLAAIRPGQVNHLWLQQSTNDALALLDIDNHVVAIIRGFGDGDLHPGVVSDVDVKRSLCATTLHNVQFVKYIFPRNWTSSDLS